MTIPVANARLNFTVNIADIHMYIISPVYQISTTAGDSSTTVDDGNSGVSSSDPTQHITQEKLIEGIDPNKDPWDTQYKPIYGG